MILQVAPSLPAGAGERSVIEIAEALISVQARALVASSGGLLVHHLTRAGAGHVVLPLDRLSLAAILGNARKLAQLIRSARVDIVHARGAGATWSALIAARRTRVPLVATIDSLAEARGPINRWRHGAGARADRMLAVSGLVAARLRARHRIDPARLEIVHRGVDLASFDPERVSGERLAQLARTWRLPDGVPVVMVPGRLHRTGNHHLVLRTFRQLMQSVPERQLHCILWGSSQGNERYRGELFEAVHRLGLSGHVQMIEECRDVAAAYMLSDAVVSIPAQPEAFDQTVLEALAMGRPVIAAAGGGGEAIRPGRTGWLVEPGDGKELAAALGEALSLGYEERQNLAAVALADVRERFSKERMCAETLTVYAQLLEPRTAQEVASPVRA